jgi:hypothetical protein
VLGTDVVAEEPRPLGACVGDQGLVPVQFQGEGIAQEPFQFSSDFLGLGFRAGESQQVIVGLCRHPGYAGVE